jgi:alpha-glucosidase (family GH31 glycosyl hydrolase)
MKDNVTQTKVLDYAKEINRYGLPNSQIEIDETWEIHYGEHKFNTKKFPNVKDMVNQLHGLGFRVTLWNTPFVNPDCDNFKTDSKYLIKNKLHEVVTHKWWNGLGANVDFSDSEARKWFVNRLEMLRNETGIDSFKFDAGEVGWINPDFQFSNQSVQQTPGVITQLYVETAAQLGFEIYS